MPVTALRDLREGSVLNSAWQKKDEKRQGVRSVQVWLWTRLQNSLYFIYRMLILKYKSANNLPSLRNSKERRNHEWILQRGNNLVWAERMARNAEWSDDGILVENLTRRRQREPAVCSLAVPVRGAVASYTKAYSLEPNPCRFLLPRTSWGKLLSISKPSFPHYLLHLGIVRIKWENACEALSTVFGAENTSM